MIQLAIAAILIVFIWWVVNPFAYMLYDWYKRPKHPVTGKRLTKWQIELIKDESGHGKIY